MEKKSLQYQLVAALACKLAIVTSKNRSLCPKHSVHVLCMRVFVVKFFGFA